MTIHVEVITPERLAYKDEVDFIAAPAVNGELGVLPNHAPLLARLGFGRLRLVKGTDERSLAVAGGFIEVQHGSRVSIFAEAAEFAEEIDVERARQAAERAKAQLAKATDLTGPELAQLEASLTRAVMRMKLAGARRKPRPEKPHA